MDPVAVRSEPRGVTGFYRIWRAHPCLGARGTEHWRDTTSAGQSQIGTPQLVKNFNRGDDARDESFRVVVGPRKVCLTNRRFPVSAGTPESDRRHKYCKHFHQRKFGTFPCPKHCELRSLQTEARDTTRQIRLELGQEKLSSDFRPLRSRHMHRQVVHRHSPILGHSTSQRRDLHL